MKKLTSFLLLALVLAFSIPVYADDTTAPTATATQATDTTSSQATLLPAHTVTTVATQAPAMPALAALPTDKSVSSIILWVIGGLFPWLGWLASEIMPFLPGKVNGFLQGGVVMLKALTYDPDKNALTLQLADLQTALADIKGQLATVQATIPAPVAAPAAPAAVQGA